MKKSTLFPILIGMGIGIIVIGIYLIGFDKGYSGGYEDAIARLYKIREKKENGSIEFPYSTVQQGLDAIPDSFEIYDNEWIWVQAPDDSDTIVFFHPFKYLKLKIVGTNKAKIHAYFPDSDSTWSHYIIE